MPPKGQKGVIVDLDSLDNLYGLSHHQIIKLLIMFVLKHSKVML